MIDVTSRAAGYFELRVKIGDAGGCGGEPKGVRGACGAGLPSPRVERQRV
jgi:hypothetical protein